MVHRSRLDACHCFAIRQAARQITRAYEEVLAEAGLTTAQFSILSLIHDNGELTISDLTDLLKADRTTVLRALKPLTRNRLVQSGLLDSERQKLAYNLTEDGLAALEAAIPLWEKAQARFEAQVGQEKTQKLRADLLDLELD
jgi:DNA-binding MarR family transcriptional regulator